MFLPILCFSVGVLSCPYNNTKLSRVIDYATKTIYHPRRDFCVTWAMFSIEGIFYGYRHSFILLTFIAHFPLYHCILIMLFSHGSVFAVIEFIAEKRREKFWSWRYTKKYV